MHKALSVVICKSRDDFIKFIDGIVFLAEYETPGLIKQFDSDEDHNPIINGVKYIHGESIHDFKNKTAMAYIFVKGWDENPRAKSLYDKAKEKTRIYGRMIQMPITLPNAKKIIV